MSKYLNILKISFLSEYTYRANVLFTIFRNAILLFISVSIWITLYGTSETINGISIKEMLNYLVVTLFMRELTRSQIADTITNRIRDGSIFIEFILPVSFISKYVFEQFGKNIFKLVFSVLPICIISYFIFQLKLTINLNLFLFIISVVSGTILMFLISYTLSLLAFWFKSAVFVRFLIRALIEIFAGTAVPLWFYPEWIYKISMFLPFRLICFSPIAIFLGKLTQDEILQVLGLQILWIIVFIAIERFVWFRARKIVTIQGG